MHGHFAKVEDLKPYLTEHLFVWAVEDASAWMELRNEHPMFWIISSCERGCGGWHSGLSRWRSGFLLHWLYIERKHDRLHHEVTDAQTITGEAKHRPLLEYWKLQRIEGIPFAWMMCPDKRKEMWIRRDFTDWRGISVKTKDIIVCAMKFAWISVCSLRSEAAVYMRLSEISGGKVESGSLQER